MEPVEARYVPAYDADDPEPDDPGLLGLLALLLLCGVAWMVDLPLRGAEWLHEVIWGPQA